MPRHVNDDLYRLVHSLSATERGYVKKYWTKYSDAADQDYAELFDILVDMPSYSSTALTAAVKGRSWAPRLSQVKNYCTSRVLEALRSYSSSATPSKQIAELLDDADLLWDRMLYDAGLKRVERARTMAATFDEFALHLRALSWLKRYRQLVLEQPAVSTDIDELSAEQQRVFERYQNSVAYEGLGNAMHHHLIMSTKGDADSRRWLDTLPSHPLLASADAPLSVSAALNRLLALCAWYRLHQPDPHQAFDHADALVHLMQANEEVFTAKPNVRDQIIFLYLDCCLELQRFDDFLGMIDRYWKPTPPTKPTADAVQHGYRLWALEVGYVLRSTRTDRITKKHDAIKRFFSEHAENIPAHSRIVNVFGMIRIFRDPFWMQQMLQESTEVRPDLHAAAMIIELMAAVEQQDRDFIRNRVRTLERFVKKHLPSTPSITAMLSFFRRWPDANANKARALIEETIIKLEQMESPHVFDPVVQSGVFEWLQDVNAKPSR